MSTAAARTWDGIVRSFAPVEQPACQGTTEMTTVAYENATAAALGYQANVCAAAGTCPVLVQCGRHAINHEPYGLWALTQTQRWNLGGVVPEDWANWVPNPDEALDELEVSGIPLSAIERIVQAAGLTNQATYDAIARRRAALSAAEKSAAADAQGPAPVFIGIPTQRTASPDSMTDVDALSDMVAA